MNVPWLTVVLMVPLGGALVLQVIPRTAPSLIKAVTMTTTLATAIIVWSLVAGLTSSPVSHLSPGPMSFHYEEVHDWVPAIGADYHLGLDGISAWILALNAGVFLLGSILDIFDGAIARSRGEDGPRGAFVDSTVDRVAEGLVLGAVALVFARHHQQVALAAVLLVLSVLRLLSTPLAIRRPH